MSRADFLADIRQAAEKRMAASEGKPNERVSWDQNVQGLGRRFHQEYKYRLLENGGGEGTDLVLGDNEEVVKLQQTDSDIGTTVYTAAVQVSRLLENLQATPNETFPSLKGATVLELGSGTGLVGLVAAALGARVLVTDLTGPVLDNLKHNVDQLPLSIRKNITVSELRWGDPVSLPDTFSKLDIILAVEVVYQKEFVPPLVDTLKQLKTLCPLSKILWSHDKRGRPGIALFKELTEPVAEFEAIPDDCFPPQYLCQHVEVFAGKWKGG
eukprot:TRINITY_DN10627_c0_g1_i1.p1 TRINITY_DN10627_c0_g1~~TRINITY_DN10627_c0_g1_i1.p1  ORF type:complete len:269 (+),score=44.16 TRINITY_DN10627_c0_g1_i1:87-893(+)